MYNSEFKERYLNENEERNASLKLNVDLLFRRIEDTESRLEKDLYNFSVKEILNYYKSLCTPSLESLMVMNNQYKLYTAYALNNGLVSDNQNHYDEIDVVQLNQCVNMALAQDKVITEKELLDIIKTDIIENVSEKFMCLALFEGICGKECVELTSLRYEDFDRTSKTVALCTGRVVEVSELLIDLAEESSKEYEYNTSTNGKCRSYHLDDPRCIKRLANSISDEPIRRQKTIRRRLDKIKSATGCNAFGIGSLQESGRLEMVRKLREKGKTLYQALAATEPRYGYLSSKSRYILKYGLTED